MQTKSIKYLALFSLTLLLIFPSIVSASQCKKDLAAVDSGIKNQYGGYD